MGVGACSLAATEIDQQATVAAPGCLPLTDQGADGISRLRDPLRAPKFDLDNLRFIDRLK